MVGNGKNVLLVALLSIFIPWFVVVVEAQSKGKLAGEIEKIILVERLCSLLESEQESSRIEKIALALGQIGDQRAITPLYEAYTRTEDKKVKKTIRLVFRNIRGDKPLVKVMEGPRRFLKALYVASDARALLFYIGLPVAAFIGAQRFGWVGGILAAGIMLGFGTKGFFW